jgi:hypothetical protein
MFDKKNFNLVKPYCYFLKRKNDGLQYFGVRWKNTTKYKRTPIEDFGKFYYSSHNVLKKEFKENPENFTFKIVRIFNTIEDARQYEMKFNKKIIKKKNWLNIQAFPQIIHSNESREKISKWHLKKKLSEITKDKVRKARLGTRISEDTKKKMSESQTGEKNHFFGKKHSPQTKLKMKNRVVTEKVRKIISEKLKGRKLSIEIIKKMAESRKGYKHSEETKKKLSNSKLGSKNFFFGKKLSSIHKNKISEGLKKTKFDI